MIDGSLPILKGDRVTLRRPVAADVDARLAIGRHAEIVRAYGGSFDPDKPFTRKEAESAITSLTEQPYAWVIDVGGFIGQVRFHSINTHDKRAMFAIGIDNPARLGQGFGTESLRLALGFGFGTSGLHRVSVRVLASNVRAIASYRKCGFLVEGREREAACVEGQWEDDLIMGLLAHEFLALQKSWTPSENSSSSK
jgi:RimJ/RimL family protein N-acetyltransferase